VRGEADEANTTTEEMTTGAPSGERLSTRTLWVVDGEGNGRHEGECGGGGGGGGEVAVVLKPRGDPPRSPLATPSQSPPARGQLHGGRALPVTSRVVEWQ
jgi:hypothetical protein